MLTVRVAVATNYDTSVRPPNAAIVSCLSSDVEVPGL